MKKLLQFLFLGFFIVSYNSAFAQLDDGEIAPDWEVTDLDGDDWSLEDFMDDGKHVILDFSATWCGPCWSYHNTHILDDLHDDYGPSGSDELFVFMFEADGDTNDACCYGPSGCNDGTWGNWTNVSYPVVNLSGSELSIVGDYELAYYPTIYIINGDHQTIWEVGQAGYSSWENIINESFTLEVDVEVDPGTCTMGTISVSSSGGSGSILYQWSTGQFGESIEVESGIYSVTATDGIGYFVEVEVEIENDQEVFALSYEDIEHVSCTGEDDGAISIEFENTGNLSFEWSNGDDDDNIEDLEPGTYFLTVTDEDTTCEGMFEFFIDEPEEMEADYEVMETSCGFSNGEVEIFVEGGAGNYLYDFGNGKILENYATGLDGGVLTVIVEDDNGCELEIDVVIPESEALQATLVGENTISCLNPEVTFTVESNSVNELNYNWTDTNGNVVSTENNVTVSVAGDYVVDLVDAVTGCSFQETFVVLEDLDLPTVTLTPVEELNCNLNNFEMSFTNDGIEPLAAQWTFTDMNGEEIIIHADVITIFEPGDYTLIVQNVMNGCESLYEFTVSQYDNTPTALFTTMIDAETVNIIASSSGNNTTETWILDGVEIDLQNGVIVFDENGFYELCYLVENECGLAEYCETIEVDGIISSTTDFIIDGVKVYTSFENIIIESSVELNDLVNITVTNASGQMVYTNTQKLTNGTNTIDVHTFASGVYFVSLEIDSGTHCTKVFKF